MHNTKELQRQLADAEGKMRELAKKVRELREQIAEQESEFKLGDVISWRFGDGRRKGQIVTVLGDGHYRVRGIKKDGTDGALQKVYSFDKIERAERAA